MSPGATFERVYLELRRRLAEGAWPPGTPLEPAILGEDLAASITPVRDALHRLTGERLVEAPNHNGFRVPLLTEAALRDLYSWNGLVLNLAARQLQTGPGPERCKLPVPATDVAASVAALFLDIAHGTGSAELAVTVGRLNARLSTPRLAEIAALDALTEELSGLMHIVATGDRPALASAVTRYHRRRVGAVGNILARLNR